MSEDVRGNTLDAFMNLQATAALAMWERAHESLLLLRGKGARNPQTGDPEFCAYAAMLVATQYLAFVVAMQTDMVSAMIDRAAEDQDGTPGAAFALELRRLRRATARRRKEIKEMEHVAQQHMLAFAERYGAEQVDGPAWKEATHLLWRLLLHKDPFGGERGPG